jgi:ubiquinone biosynthesis protein
MSKTIQVQDLPRVNRIVAVLARNGFGHLISLTGLRGQLEDENDLATDKASKKKKSFAKRLRQVLIDLGPTYVKLGQILSVRPDILPEDVLNEFQTLQDHVPPMPFEDVRWVVEDELQRPLEELFEEFEREPLGSASIAQVHGARLPTGEQVAVKLQRRGIEKTIRSDIHILYSLAQLLENSGITLPGLYGPTAIVREFDVAIRQELDFVYELKNAERMARLMAQSDVIIPDVYPQWSSRRVMVLERIEGIPLQQAMNTLSGEDARVLAHQIMEATYAMVFEHGFFHGDPHPGNLFVTPDNHIAYLDFGVVGTLTGAMQDTVVGTFTSMVFRDAEALAMTVYRAGANQGRIDLRKFIDEIERKLAKYHGASLDDLANRATFVEIIQLCADFQLSLPSEFAILARAITLVEGECRALLPGVDIVEEVKPYAKRLMVQRFSPERVAHDLARMMVMAQGQLRELPTQMTQVLMDLEGGDISIITRDPEAHLLREEIRSAVLRLSLAALASTVTLGSMLFLAQWSPGWFGVPVVGLFGLTMLVVGLALFGALGIHVVFARFLGLRAWRNRLLAFIRFFSWRTDG